jgi:hypothetical protein
MAVTIRPLLFLELPILVEAAAVLAILHIQMVELAEVES